MSGSRFALLAAGTGAVVGVALTFPLVLHLGSAILDDGTYDGFQFVWNLWWVRESLVRLHTNPFYTTYLFHPYGASLLLHTLTFTQGLASLPLQAILPGGPVAAQGVLVMAAPGLAVLGVGLLAREVTGDAWAALAAGLVAAINAMQVWALPNLYVSSSYLIAFLLWAWWRMHRLQRARDVLVAVGMLAALLFGSLEYTVVALGLLAIDSLCRLLAPHRCGLEHRWIGGMLAFWTCAGAALGGLAWAALSQPAQAPSPQLVTWATGYVSGFVTPPWLAPPAVPFFTVLYLGTAPLLLVTVGVLWRRRRTAYWLVAAMACVLMALGPTVHLLDPFTHASQRTVPGPYAVALRLAPSLAFSRNPYRWTAGAIVALSVVVALVVTACRERLGGASRTAFTAGVLGLIVAAGAVDVRGLRAPMVSTEVPAAYAVLRDDPQPAAILELPAGSGPGGFVAYSSLYMYYQTLHRKYLLDGTIPRWPRDHAVRIGLLADFAKVPFVKYAVLHRDLLRASTPDIRGLAQRIETLLGSQGELVVEESDVAVYRLRTFLPETVR